MRSVVVLGLGLGLALGPAAQAAPLGLDDVVRRVLERGPDRAVVAALVDVARTDVQSARMFPNPGLAFSAGQSEPVFAASVQLHLPIFGQRSMRVRAAERGQEQAAAEGDASLWHLRHEARVAYYTAARADEEVGIAVELERLTGRVAEMARERLDVGAGTRLDSEEARLVHVRALQDVSDRRAAARVAHLALARLAALPPDDTGALSDGLARLGPTPPVAELAEAASRSHPQLRALERERAAALARLDVGRADRRPTPTVELGAELLDPSTCNAGRDNGPRCVGPRAALSFDVPLFNWNRGPIARAEAEAHLAERRSEAERRRIESEVQSAYESFRAATVRARFFDADYLPTADAVEAMAREGFAAGKSGILPLIEAERAVQAARLGRAEALFAVQSARANLEEASGVPLSLP